MQSVLRADLRREQAPASDHLPARRRGQRDARPAQLHVPGRGERWPAQPAELPQNGGELESKFPMRSSVIPVI